MNSSQLAPSTLLYRFSIPCNYTASQWSTKGIQLGQDYLLPMLSELNEQAGFAEIKTAWNEKGLFFTVQVVGKQQNLWCRHTQMLESDRLMVWLDTRNTHNVHRATRFCHWFLAMPLGEGRDSKKPLTTMLKINRSKEDSPTLNQNKQLAVSKLIPGGYELYLHIPANNLNGWDPAEHTRIGFNYAIVDRELGWQTLATGPELPIEQDPTLWHTLELVGR